MKIDGSVPVITVTYDKGGGCSGCFNTWGARIPLRDSRVHRQYRLNPDHPVLQDFIASMRPFAPDATAFDTFVKQWFFEATVPEYRLSNAKLTELPETSNGTKEWEVTVHVENAGTGKMPIDVAPVRGERFNEDGAASPEYQDARERIILGPGESKDVTIRAFKPDRVIVDPTAVLQLLRKLAVVEVWCFIRPGDTL